MKKTQRYVNIIIASGGTGGHLFPAQALALEMRQNTPHIHITFVGTGLTNSAYFKRDCFTFLDIKSGTPIKKNPLQLAKALLSIIHGLIYCVKYYKEHSPDLIVGFGSYHTFPALCAGKLKNIPIILFESNVVPGRVNRFCSKWAKVSAIQFPQTAKYVKGKTCCVHMPLFQQQKTITKKQARHYFHLDVERVTLLVFGGSQGSVVINSLFCNALEALLTSGLIFQVIHIVGSDKSIEQFQLLYKKQKVLACVKSFEGKMEYAWRAADLAISRAGGATLAELIEFVLPSILIPYPFGSEKHQNNNAAYIADEIRGGIVLEEKGLHASVLAKVIIDLLSGEKLCLMKRALYHFKEGNKKQNLCSLVLENI